jgi:hypothetical protein
MPNSYNGWPASENKASINVVQHPVYAGGIKAGDVTTVLQYVSDQLNARVESIVMGHCWGYAYRDNVNNPGSLSCHASGTAIDFNAPAHPNGASNTFSSAQVNTIKQILKEVENSVKWLQGYDEMHFEIGVNASTLAGVASRLKGSGGTTPPPATGDDDLPLNDADKKYIADTIRGQLNQYFANGEGNPQTGRIQQAISHANIHNKVWDVVMPGNASGGSPETQEPGRKGRDTMSALMTMISRMYKR